MGKKFIQVDETNRVTFVHYMPFDQVDGLDKTESELLQMGYLVDVIPEIAPVAGKNGYHQYDPNFGIVNVVYDDLPLTPEQQKIIDLQNSVVELQNTVNFLLGI